MKNRLLAAHLIILVVLASFRAVAQDDLILLSGRVDDSDTRQPIPGAGVLIKNTVAGTITNDQGEFTLKTRVKFPFTLVFQVIGYAPKEIVVERPTDKISVSLNTQAILGNEVVVTASRIEESILKSPVAVEKLNLRVLKESPAPSFYDALENVKGVQMTTSSLTFKVPNTRGFNIPNNFRFMQLVDGVDMQAATLGVPLGNAIGPTELDIESVEITPGAASALYGMNAINGLANLLTKSPFQYQGVSLYQKTGVNHIDGIDRDPSILTESAVRIAKAFNNRFAFKLNFSYLQGTDWLANNQTDQNPQPLNTANPRFPELSGASNPARDLWNQYGDDGQARVAITIPYNGRNETFNVSRTGYLERDLVNPRVRNLKFDGSLHYRLNDRVEVQYGYRYGLMDGIFQRGNRIQLTGVTVQNHKLELRSTDLVVRAYVLSENTGQSYNLNPLAYNLDLNNGTNAVWGAKFRTELLAQVNSGTNLATAMQLARVAADRGRVEPGTAAFESLKQTIVNTNNWDIGSIIPGAPATGGAALWQQSRTYHSDIQYNLSQRIKFAEVLVGADYRRYEVIPDGNNFVDFSKPIEQRTTPGGANQIYTKYGAFVSATKLLLADRLKVAASLRVDNNPEFSPKVNPRLALVYTAAERHNFRFTYQNGFRFPSLFEALSYVNNSNVRRVGGLARVNEGLGFLENSYTLASLNNFNAAVNTDVAAGSTRNAAALRNRGLLQVANLSPSQPEHINSLEVGYKSVLLNNRLAIDGEAYYNSYQDFLGQVEVAVPTTGRVGTDASVLDMLTRANQVRYRVYTNAKNTYRSYGAALGITYNFYRKFTSSGNVNYNNIAGNDNPDIFVTGFNTPRYVANVSIGNREVAKNLGFNVVWRWQDSFLWQSPLANGTIPAYHTVDAQMTYKVPQPALSFKLGASNLFNNRYIQYAAGPTIGGLYYLAITYDVTRF
ncbi:MULTISPECIES: TonB-dependent receptor [Spirosoma]|uniref:TonB-dependent receptor n=1 Tax=Spirosoma sordidisoli TaxID=2502893 RepID=A0A4Q2UG03_9BACT|nr:MULTISPECIES: TonB-dependent receptor [Spirosoma]RYC66301.1 TonB-dependent receptor [Spirosoma sordidisoli]